MRWWGCAESRGPGAARCSASSNPTITVCTNQHPRLCGARAPWALLRCVRSRCALDTTGTSACWSGVGGGRSAASAAAEHHHCVYRSTRVGMWWAHIVGPLALRATGGALMPRCVGRGVGPSAVAMCAPPHPRTHPQHDQLFFREGVGGVIRGRGGARSRCARSRCALPVGRPQATVAAAAARPPRSPRVRTHPTPFQHVWWRSGGSGRRWWTCALARARSRALPRNSVFWRAETVMWKTALAAAAPPPPRSLHWNEIVNELRHESRGGCTPSAPSGGAPAVAQPFGRKCQGNSPTPCSHHGFTPPPRSQNPHYKPPPNFEGAPFTCMHREPQSMGAVCWDRF